MNDQAGKLQAAKALADEGCKILPLHDVRADGQCSCERPDCSSPGKHPRIVDWQKQATSDLTQIETWSRQWAEVNFGVATGQGLLVMDVDVRPDKDGRIGVGQLERQYEQLSPTWTVKTGGGGLHFYFRVPEGITIKNSAGRIASGLDIRGDGGYVVAPGSNHASGSSYGMIEPDAEIADAPEWLIELCLKPASPETPPGGGLLEPGRRNTDLATLAGALRRQGLGEAGIEGALRGVNGTLDAPLPDFEICAVARSIARYPYPIVAESLTEQSVAEALSARLADRFNYCPALGWSRYADGRWQEDPEGMAIQEEAKKLIDDIKLEFEGQQRGGEAGDQKARSAVKATQRKPFVTNVIGLAKSDPRVLVSSQAFDGDRSLFNLRNGTLDLRTRRLRPYNPADLLTRMAKVEYDPEARCPRFDDFLEQVLPGETGTYLMRALAYATLGSLRHQCMFVLVGDGRNGKSTLLELMLGLFGDYSRNTEVETFLRRNGSGENHELARLDGARLIVTSEVPNGGILNASLIKKFTGNDTITARRLYKSAFEYKPAGVIFMATNHLPVIDGGDFGLSRRMKAIPFSVRIADQDMDPELEFKLSEERSGILNRLIDALEEYRSIGLAEPEEVKRFTSRYIDESDVLKGFLEESCECHDGSDGISARNLYDLYRQHCASAGLQPLSLPGFKKGLEAKGYSSVRRSAGVVWKGLRMKGAAGQWAMRAA